MLASREEYEFALQSHRRLLSGRGTLLNALLERGIEPEANPHLQAVDLQLRELEEELSAFELQELKPAFVPQADYQDLEAELLKVIRQLVLALLRSSPEYMFEAYVESALERALQLQELNPQWPLDFAARIAVVQTLRREGVLGAAGLRAVVGLDRQASGSEL